MIRPKNLISVTFDKTIGITNNDFTNVCWYEIGKFLPKNESSYYRGVLRIINAGVGGPPSEAIIIINCRNSSLKISTNSPINHGTFVAVEHTSGEYYSLLFKPSYNFLGDRVLVSIVEEVGDLASFIYNPNPIQRSNNNPKRTISAKFEPDSSFCVPIHNVTNLPINTITPCFTVSETFVNNSFLEFSARMGDSDNNDNTGMAVVDLIISLGTASYSSPSVYMKRPLDTNKELGLKTDDSTHQTTPDGELYDMAPFYYTVNGKSLTLYSSRGYSTANNYNMFCFKTIHCSLSSAIGQGNLKFNDTGVVRVNYES